MSLDPSTVHLCDALLNFSYGSMFLAIWYRRKERHFLLWAASLLLIAGVVFGFAFARSHFLVALLLGGVAANVTFVWAGIQSFDGRSPFHWRMAVVPTSVSLAYWLSALAGETRIGSAIATFLLAVNVLLVGRYLLAVRVEDGGLGRQVVGWATLAYVPVYVVSGSLSALAVESSLTSTIILVADLVLNNVFVAGLFLMAEDRIRVRLQDLASKDQLTGALNRGGLFTRLNTLPQTTQMAFLLADLDYFKAINDRFGHAAGDAVLRAFVARVLAVTRGDAFVGRLGGEEFGIVLPFADFEAGTACAEAIRLSMEGCPVDWNNVSIHATVSIGVAASHPGEVVDVTMRRADEALYRAKACGRNRIAA